MDCSSSSDNGTRGAFCGLGFVAAGWAKLAGVARETMPGATTMSTGSAEALSFFDSDILFTLTIPLAASLSAFLLFPIQLSTCLTSMPCFSARRTLSSFEGRELFAYSASMSSMVVGLKEKERLFFVAVTSVAD